MGKSKRYEEGGVTEGQNAGIGDDTRARAMKFVQEQSEKSSANESSGEKAVSRSPVPKPTSNAATRNDPDAPVASSETPRMRTKEEIRAAIPTGGKAGAGPTESKGNSASGSELGRNVSALMNATGPGKLATGLTLAAREAKAAKGIQDAYNARAAARRSEEGLNAAEAAAAKAASAAKATRAEREAKVAPRRTREAKTMNPNAWMAGPKGMREDFKKGGSVKSSASSRGDGIASRGKTRGRIC
jgi:hypothetical protein